MKSPTLTPRDIAFLAVVFVATALFGTGLFYFWHPRFEALHIWLSLGVATLTTLFGYSALRNTP